MSAPDAKLGELSHETIMNIIQQLSDCGVMNVSITGGEPLVRSDFLEIVDALLERDICIKEIYSNGALVNEELLKALDSRNIHTKFDMSYDGEGWHGRAARRKALDARRKGCRRGGEQSFCIIP